MKLFLTIAASALAFAVTAVPADAKGCIKGAVVGGAAGHLAHHTLLGAAAGCVIGHHEAAKRAREERELQEQQNQPASAGPAVVPAKQP
jgi:outer membrane lipoprotein SlyB